MLLLAACGGNERSAVSSGESPTSSTSTTSFDELIATESPTDGPNVFVVVTNQSFDHPNVHLTVAVRGQAFVDEVFPVKGQHHHVEFPISLPPGDHRLVATSDTGAERGVDVSVPAESPTYVHVGYWASEEEAPHFVALVRDEPFVYG